MRLRRFSVALSSPLGTARGDIREREGFLVGVESGVGEATPLPGWTESLAACESALDAARTGPDPPALNDFDVQEVPAARHGLALALADRAARNAGQSLAERLARRYENRTEFRPPADSVPVNATVGDGSPEETVAAAERAVDEGFDCVKVKVGARAVDADVRRLRAVRATLGSDVDLRADANGAWDAGAARQALDRLEPVDLEYIEQPLPAAELSETARLRSATDVPIALDESLATHSVETVLTADAADIIVLKPMALGGPDRAVDVARRAREAGVEPVVTTTIDAVVARTAAVHVAGAIPDVAACGLATSGLLADDLAPDPCPVADGRIAVPDGPGLAGDAFRDLL